jgi:hypothetical protein
MGASRILGAAVAVALCAYVAPAVADDLVIPYACSIENGTPRLQPSSPSVYHIIGPREDKPFSACGPSQHGSCEMMMIHKFSIDCGGKEVSWARVAASAQALGIQLPRHLPAGFAPVSRLAGRFVLPRLLKSKPAVTHVSMRDLSPDSVIETGSTRRLAEPAQWVTVVASESKPSPSSEAFKVAGVVFSILLMLMGGCLVAARRRALPSLEFAALSGTPGELVSRVSKFLKRSIADLGSAFRHSYECWLASEGKNASSENSLAKTLSLVHARLTETELLVAGLPAELLLRAVLQSELDGVRERVADVARRVRRLGDGRANAMLRAFMRDLDRITRIVHGAAQRTEDAAPGEADAPSTVFEAYRILGLNPDAPYAAVKKVVDALRMSWHPDHARDEADRLYREVRIKQINAAWDLLKDARAAAA